MNTDLAAWNGLARFERDCKFTVEAFRSWFAINRGAAQLLEAFYLLPQRWHSLNDLSRLTTFTPGTCRVFISQLRKAMDEESIDARPGGYSLTEVGVADCNAALAEHKRLCGGGVAAE